MPRSFVDSSNGCKKSMRGLETSAVSGRAFEKADSSFSWASIEQKKPLAHKRSQTSRARDMSTRRKGSQNSCRVPDLISTSRNGIVLRQAGLYCDPDECSSRGNRSR